MINHLVWSIISFDSFFVKSEEVWELNFFFGDKVESIDIVVVVIKNEFLEMIFL